MTEKLNSEARSESPVNSLRKERSCAYPAHNLEDSIEAVSKLNSNLGKGPFNRESAAVALGYKGVSGASAIKISACAQFGLLMRSGNTYYISDLARKILVPTSEEERRTAILEAVETPSLYSSLISTYADQALPTMLTNILCRNYGVIENSAPKAANIFRESLEYAGLLKNGAVRKTGETIYAEEPVKSSGTATPTNETSIVAPVDFMELDLPGVDAKLVLSKKYTFALSMGELAKEIKALKDALERISEEERLNDESQN